MSTVRKFLCLLLLIVTGNGWVAAQRSAKGLFSLGFGLDLPSDITVISGDISGAGRIPASPVYVGVGVQIANIETVKKPLIPVYLNLVVLPSTKTKAVPMAVGRPGLGLTGGTGNSGGFTFFGGAGVAFKGDARTYLLVGYSHYAYARPFSGTSLQGFGLRGGFLL